MSDIKLTAIKRAIGLLAAAGAQYRIIYEGEELINMIPEKKKGKPRGRYAHNFKDIYKPVVDQLADPKTSVVTIHVPDGYEVGKVRSAAAAYLTQKFGPGTCITSVNNSARTIEVLYVR